jgi:hypothetical protein
MPASEPRSSAAGAPWTSYGEDGTIFGLPDSSVQLEFVRSTELAVGVDRVDMLVLSPARRGGPGAVHHEDGAAGMNPTWQHPYWQANGGVTYQDPDGCEVVFLSWVYGRNRT